MNAPARMVYVVEDDPAYQKALCRLLAAAGLAVQAFGSVEAYLQALPGLAAGCLVLDVRLPGASGLDLQQAFLRAGRRMPIIFLTGHGDIPMSVRAMRDGAVDFLTKPVQGAALLQSIDRALVQGDLWRVEEAELRELCRCYQSLTPREREVYQLVVEGLMNKQVADRLGTTVRTIKAHRAQIMTKMKASTLVDLVRAAARLNQCAWALLPAGRPVVLTGEPCTKVQ